MELYIRLTNNIIIIVEINWILLWVIALKIKLRKLKVVALMNNKIEYMKYTYLKKQYIDNISTISLIKIVLL